ncbi:MAG TPA: type IV secretion system DNA-binding domain-containing protein, partial [Patescibacteria group bacterium]|nr:type IV secretion system DNA-binding domain-containing protein [Patescibacteria group bacterium]
MPAEAPEPYSHDHENEVVLFGETNFRNQKRRFGIKTDDRRRHMYVLGKTGMGKTTLLENMVLADVYAGHGLAYVDPHGDTAEKLLDFIPPHRINDVVYFNPADMEFPIGFNILETVDEGQKHLVAAGLMGVFKKIWPDVWSSRMEYILLNTIMALLDFPGSTLLGINRLLSDAEYRKRVVSLIQDPVVKTFWTKEFASFSEKYRTEAVAPLQNKVGQFLSATIIRNIVAQVKSTINMRDIMDTRKILIVNLAKGRIGEENSRLLGAMIITRLQLSAMERVDMPEKDRQDFYLYVDEFQNFATQSFANILSEARKYRLALIVAHQYIEQLEEEVRAAIFGNVGTLIIFRVGAADATFMEQEFTPRFTPEDLVNLKKYEIYLKLMIDGASSEPFSASTLAPIAERTGATDRVVKVSRERYSTPRKVIEEKVIKWSGFGTIDTGQVLMTEDEEEAAIAEKIKALEATSPDVGEMATPADGGG